ncbi:MAG: thioredoxin family protein [Cyanobacteria bacterium TGS_CYA1]|nr:thioredoxin family protein [Cyanobacteria bacterium TGS_CYA1]
MVKAFLSALIFLSIACTAAYSHPQIFSNLPMDEALEKAQKENKYLLLDFTASWCGPCKQMDESTWTNPEVENWIKKNAVALQIDVDEQKELAQKFNIAAMPTVILFQSQNLEKEFDRSKGFKEPEKLLSWLDGIANNITSIDLARREVKKFDSKISDESMSARYDLGIKLLESNKYDEATKHFLYVWKNGAQTAMVGVRGSYMIDQIRLLCKKSKSSKLIFEKLRDESQSDRDDWIMLNEALDQNKKSLEWFDKAKNDLQEKNNLEDAHIPLESLLLAEDRWADIAYLYPEPMQSLKNSLEDLKSFRKFAAESNDNSQSLKDLQSTYNPFIDTASILYAAFLASGDDNVAKSIANEAFKQENSLALKRALLSKAEKANQFRWWHLIWRLESATFKTTPADLINFALAAFIATIFTWLLLIRRMYFPILAFLLICIFNFFTPSNSGYVENLFRSFAMPILSLFVGVKLVLDSSKLTLIFSEYQQGNLEGALSKAVSASSKEPKNIDLLVYISIICVSLNKYDLAFKNSEKIISLKPKLAVGYLMKSHVLICLNRLNEALDLLKIGSGYLLFFDTIYASSIRQYESLILALQGKADESRLKLKKAGIGSFLNPQYYLLTAAFIHLLNDDMSEATNSINKMLKMRLPPLISAYAHSMNARILLKQQLLEQALEEANIALKHKRLAGVLAVLGLIKTRMNKAHEGLILIEESLEMDPHSVETYYFRQETFLVLGEDKKAEADNTKIEELGGCRFYLN